MCCRYYSQLVQELKKGNNACTNKNKAKNTAEEGWGVEWNGEVQHFNNSNGNNKKIKQ